MRMLVIRQGGGADSPERRQVLPFALYRQELREQFGLDVELTTAPELADITTAVRDRRPDVAAIMPDWREKPEDVAAMFDGLRSTADPPQLILLDSTALACSPFFGLLPHVDCFVRRQRLNDLDLYQRDYEGGQPFTDFLAREMGFDLDGWHFAAKPDPAYLDRLMAGWNLGVAPHYHRWLRATRPFQALWRLRPIDVHRRFSPEPLDKKREWYEEYRHRAAVALDPLKSRRRMTGSERVRRRRYLAELFASKLVVSPFGWGEGCFRDFECVAAGALLVKPSMDHLATQPNIYKPHETYVPVQWDLSDLPDACEYYLHHPAEAMRIIANAQDALQAFHEGEGCVRVVRQMLNVARRTCRGPALEAAASS